MIRLSDTKQERNTEILTWQAWSFLLCCGLFTAHQVSMKKFIIVSFFLAFMQDYSRILLAIHIFLVVLDYGCVVFHVGWICVEKSPHLRVRLHVNYYHQNNIARSPLQWNHELLKRLDHSQIHRPHMINQLINCMGSLAC
jgi:hypothetical protein